MPILHSIATGNFLTSTTWGDVQSNLFLDSRSTVSTVSTTLTSSGSFSPSTNVTIQGVSIQIGGRSTTPSGTFTVDLFNFTTLTSLTQVIVNVSDIPNTNQVSPSGDNGPGWMYFKFPSTQNLVAGTLYTIRLATSQSNQVSVYRDATVNNWSRALVSTVNATPGSSDTLIIAGTWTTASTYSSVTVTMNSTSVSTAYGLTYVSNYGKLAWPTSSGTYQLRLNNALIITKEGVVEMGTVSNPITSATTATLEISASTTNQFYIRVIGGSFISYGQSTTVKAKLAADRSAGNTTSTTDISTGWLSGDTIGVASTTRTQSQAELITLNGNATGTSLSHSAYVNAHGGNSTTLVQADMIKLNRNVTIQSTSSANTTNFIIQGWQPVVSSFYTSFRNLGGGGTPSHLFYSSVSGSGSTEMEYCSFWCPNSISNQPGPQMGINPAGMGTGIFLFDFSNNVLYGFSSTAFNFTTITTPITAGQPTINNNVFMRSQAVSIGIIRGSFSGNTSTSNSLNGVTFSYSTSSVTGIPNLDNNTFYSNGSFGAEFNFNVGDSTTTLNPVINNLRIWRNNSRGISLSVLLNRRESSVTFNNMYMFGNNGGINLPQGSFGTTIIQNSFIWGGATLIQDSGIVTSNSQMSYDTLYILNTEFGKDYLGNISNLSTAAIASVSRGNGIVIFNSNFNSTTEVNTSTALAGYVYSQFPISFRHNNVEGSNKTWTNAGTILTDTTIFDVASPSIKMSPSTANFKLATPSVRIPVTSGSTCQVSVRVRKSISTDPSGANYNGNQPRLMYRYNPMAGTTGDTVGSTMTAALGTWETLTYTTPAVNRNSVLEFFVDCDGTTGWVNVDNWSTTSSNDSKGTLYWAPFVTNYIEPDFSTSSGGGEKSFTFFG